MYAKHVPCWGLRDAAYLELPCFCLQANLPGAGLSRRGLLLGWYIGDAHELLRLQHVYQVQHHCHFPLLGHTLLTPWLPPPIQIITDMWWVANPLPRSSTIDDSKACIALQERKVGNNNMVHDNVLHLACMLHSVMVWVGNRMPTLAMWSFSKASRGCVGALADAFGSCSSSSFASSSCWYTDNQF